ncbi:glycoside hydrolase family 57 [Candidatus Pseudothioglobus singularis]|nr:glycoside hydrolase family 57 [Candidatus Pseudothioglobus singularis]
MLNLYNFFHLNIAYSAIEMEEHHVVIDRCYWPLLRLARKYDLPFGIELSGYTLERIAEIDLTWVEELKKLIKSGSCELIGCGYAQVIGPLVPADVTLENLRIGNQVYEDILGCRPTLALLNEQVYSAGMASLYLEAGYEAIIMEWNNSVRSNPDWSNEWRYLPHYACGTGSIQIPFIWNDSISFQKFQRYVHGEIELNEFLVYVRKHKSNRERAFPIYGNDVEIFDFRPGRYMTEAPLQSDGEWVRIDRLYSTLINEPKMSFILPSKVLDLQYIPGANQKLRLESAAYPIPVKKQDKYNPTRWAVTGRDDLGINTRCWQLFKALRGRAEVVDDDWKELCYLWSSDFRTHITAKKWSSYQQRLDEFSQRFQIRNPITPKEKYHIGMTTDEDKQGLTISVKRQGRMLVIMGERIIVKLNCSKGLALDSFIDLADSKETLCGTIHHGYFNDISFGADYYSGHLVFEAAGQAKITDLNTVEPEWVFIEGGVQVNAVIDTPLGVIRKYWKIYDKGARLVLSYQLVWEKPIMGSLRLGYLTLIPKVFKSNNMIYRAHNGGKLLDTFTLDNSTVNHGRAVSLLITANQIIGNTEGEIEIGDSKRRIRIQSLHEDIYFSHDQQKRNLYHVTIEDLSLH